MKRHLLDRRDPRSGLPMVHAEGCVWLGLATAVLDLGFHADASSALAQAGYSYPDALRCSGCSPADQAGCRPSRTPADDAIALPNSRA